MFRRTFILGGSAGLVAATVALGAEKTVGFLATVGPQAMEPYVARLRAGLAARGWVEGSTLSLDIRYGDGTIDRLRTLAVELAASRPTVVLVYALRGAQALRAAAPDLPIVLNTSGDPTRTGLAASIARPGQKTTGLYWPTDGLIRKQLALFHEAFPRVKQIGFVYGRGSDVATSLADATTEGAQQGFEVVPLEIESAASIAAALERLGAGPGTGIYVFDTPVTAAVTDALIQALAAARLPSIVEADYLFWAGGLMAYGPDDRDREDRLAACIDAVLRGGDPAVMPFQLPTRYRLQVNMRTARVIGVTPDDAFMAQVDDVVE